jgi:hypothetical protein
MIRLLAACLCGLSLAPLAWSDEASKRAKIEEVLVLTNAPAMYKQMAEQSVSGALSSVRSMLKQMDADLPKEASAMIDEFTAQTESLILERMSWEKLKPDMMAIYAEAFTEDEISGVIEFYRSPAGQALLKKMPALASKLIQFGQERADKLLPDIMARAEELVEKIKAKYAPK